MNEVFKILEEDRISYKVVKVPRAKTVEHESSSLGLDKSKIVKTIVMIADEKVFAILLRGNKRVNINKVKSKLNAEKAKMAKPEEVKVLTGQEIGCVPPLINGIETIIDIDLLTEEGV
jgi:prolyl-tRNA synthetase